MTASAPSTQSCRYLLRDETRCPNPAEDESGLCAEHGGARARDLEVFKLVQEHFRQDLRLYWERGNFYLLIEGVLASVFATLVAKGSAPVSLVVVSFGAFGLVLSVIWWLVMVGSLHWIRQWRKEVIRLDGIVDRHQIWVRVETSVNSRPWASPSAVTRLLPLLFTLGWAVWLGFYLFA